MNKLNTQKISEINIEMAFRDLHSGEQIVLLMTKLNQVIKWQNDQLQTKRKQRPLSKSKGVKREKKKGIGKGTKTEIKELETKIDEYEHLFPNSMEGIMAVQESVKMLKNKIRRLKGGL